MKLIIDIPEEAFNEVREKENIDITTLNSSIRAIENGTPLDDVKAEIEELFKTPARYMPNYDAYRQCLEIIDKHIGKAESEDKE